MAYNQFTLPKVIADFGLTLQSVDDLFPRVPSVAVPPETRGLILRNVPLASVVNTEAARSHFVIGPLLSGVWHASSLKVALYAGTRFDVDDAAGLNGVCDYILGKPPQMNFVSNPVMVIVEAKNEDIPGGHGQCAAEMVAAQRFNAARGNTDPLFGAVTDGIEWQFVRLDDKELTFALPVQLPTDVDRLFGILLHCVGLNPVPA